MGKELLDRAISAGAKPSSMLAKDCFDQIEKIYERDQGEIPHPSGFKLFDRTIGGFPEAALSVLAGPPSVGVSQLASQMAWRVAQAGHQVLVFSLDDSPEIWIMQQLLKVARVDWYRLRLGYLNDEDWSRLAIAAKNLSERPIYVAEQKSIGALIEVANVWREDWKGKVASGKRNSGLIVVDGFSRIKQDSDKYEGKRSYTKISESLATLAAHSELPVLVTCTLRQLSGKREDIQARLSDLREYGGLDQLADLVLLLYRDESYDSYTEEQWLAKIVVARNRTGFTGHIMLGYQEHLQRFYDFSETLSSQEIEEGKEARERNMRFSSIPKSLTGFAAVRYLFKQWLWWTGSSLRRHISLQRRKNAKTLRKKC